MRLALLFLYDSWTKAKAPCTYQSSFWSCPLCVCIQFCYVPRANNHNFIYQYQLKHASSFSQPVWIVRNGRKRKGRKTNPLVWITKVGEKGWELKRKISIFVGPFFFLTKSNFLPFLSLIFSQSKGPVSITSVALSLNSHHIIHFLIE